MVVFLLLIYLMLFLFSFLLKSGILSTVLFAIWFVVGIVSIIELLSERYNIYVSFAWSMIIVFVVPSVIGAIFLVTYNYNIYVWSIQYWSVPLIISYINSITQKKINFLKLTIYLKFSVNVKLTILLIMYVLARIITIQMYRLNASSESIPIFWNNFPKNILLSIMLLNFFSKMVLGFLLYKINRCNVNGKKLMLTYGLLVMDFGFSHCMYPIVYGTLYGGDIWRHLGNIAEIIRNGNYGPHIIGSEKWTILDRNNLINGRIIGKQYIVVMGLPVPYALVSDKISYSYLYSFILFITRYIGITKILVFLVKWMPLVLWSMILPVFMLSIFNMLIMNNANQFSKVFLFLPFLYNSFYFINIYSGLPLVPISFSAVTFLIPIMIIIINQIIHHKEYLGLIFLLSFNYFAVTLAIIMMILIKKVICRMDFKIDKGKTKLIFTSIWMVFISVLPTMFDTFENRTTFKQLDITIVIKQIVYYLLSFLTLKNFSATNDPFYLHVFEKLNFTENLMPFIKYLNDFYSFCNLIIIGVSCYYIFTNARSQKNLIFPFYYITTLISAFISFYLMEGSRPLSLRMNVPRDLSLLFIYMSFIMFLVKYIKYHPKILKNRKIKIIYFFIFITMIGVNSTFITLLNPIGYNVSKSEMDTALNIIKQDPNASILASPLCLLSLRWFTGNTLYYGGFSVKGRQNIESIVNSLYLSLLHGELEIDTLKEYTNSTIIYTVINSRLYGNIKLDALYCTRYLEEIDEKLIYNAPDFWDVYEDGVGKYSVILSEETNETCKELISLRITVGAGSYRYVGAKQVYEEYQDWSSKDFLIFYLYGINSGKMWRVRIFAPNASNYFFYNFLDTWTGWKRVVIPLSAFSEPVGKPDWSTVKTLAIYYEPGAYDTYFFRYIVVDVGQGEKIETYVLETLAKNKILIYKLDLGNS